MFYRLYSTKTVWFIEHLLFASLPVYLAVMRYADQPFVHYGLMVAVILYMVVITRYFNVSLRELGITFRRSNFVAILPFTLAVSVAVLLLKYLSLLPAVVDKSVNLLIIYTLVSVPLQEIVFRSFCIWRCELTWQSRVFYIVFNSLNFAFYHIMFGSFALVIGIFIISLYWSHHYLNHRDIVSIMLSHAIIGLAYFL